MTAPQSVCVVGLGKIGLPLSVQFARSGLHVYGADISDRVVELVNAAKEPFPGEVHLEEYLGEAIANGSFTATTDTAAAVAKSEVVIIVVPLIVDNEGQPDFAIMDAATAAVADGLRPGTLVSYETTLPVGSTRNRFTPMLERGSGLTAGEDLLVCHSPERVYSGRIFADLSAYPKLIGGIDQQSTERAREFYEAALQFDQRDDLAKANGVWDLGSVEAAELAKVAETTYRDINIAFANELAQYSDRIGIDVHKVIDACNSQPFSHIHRPGIAVGGHCIPVYPRFYLSGDPEAKMPAAAREVNLSMPEYAVTKLETAIGSLSGSSVAVLGVAYRGGVKESAFSGVFDVVRELRARGANPSVHDPLYTTEEIESFGFDEYTTGHPVDAAILQADHPEYEALTHLDLPGASHVLDGRNFLNSAVERGFVVINLGSKERPVGMEV